MPLERVILPYLGQRKANPVKRSYNFAVPPTRLNGCSLLTPFEKFYNLLKQEPVNVRSGFFPDSIKARLNDVVYSGFRSYSQLHALFLQSELSNTLKDLNSIVNDNTIVIMKPDKGNVVV